MSYYLTPGNSLVVVFTCITAFGTVCGSLDDWCTKPAAVSSGVVGSVGLALVTLVDRGLTPAEGRTWAARGRQVRRHVLPPPPGWSILNLVIFTLQNCLKHFVCGTPDHGVPPIAHWNVRQPELLKERMRSRAFTPSWMSDDEASLHGCYSGICNQFADRIESDSDEHELHSKPRPGLVKRYLIFAYQVLRLLFALSITTSGFIAAIDHLEASQLFWYDGCTGLCVGTSIIFMVLAMCALVALWMLSIVLLWELANVVMVVVTVLLGCVASGIRWVGAVARRHFAAHPLQSDIELR
ncbi:hypothetical protein AURDEDRAFT_169946 [Auricularia subglabra TFB-10046 SS5]|uniref:Transmembrane protein n=1 Tax=Auricularia subglabra (strain TFB-10046 / SS5) TaxID=717982 RepID=J0D2I3_AURST|nr:hypothetical protein AURDEDRAFT_169946 [Auricularia subglabra TFB-10046 SS5]